MSEIGIGKTAPLEPYVCFLNGVEQSTSKEFAVEFEALLKKLSESKERLEKARQICLEHVWNNSKTDNIDGSDVFIIKKQDLNKLFNTKEGSD